MKFFICLLLTVSYTRTRADYGCGCEEVKDVSDVINTGLPFNVADSPMISDSITCPDAAFPVLYFIPDATMPDPLEITNVMCDATTGQWKGTIDGVTEPLAPKYTAPFNFVCAIDPTDAQTLD